MTIEAATVNLTVVGQEMDLNVHMSQETIVGLMALMCAVISIMGFLSVLPWHDICRSRDEYMAAKLANTGLKKKVIQELSSLVYSKLRSELDSVECPICLADFIEGEKVRVLPKCEHSFHMECVDKWFVSHSSCPTCRRCLLQKEAPVIKSEAKQIQCSTSTAVDGQGTARDIECGVGP